MSPSTTFQYQRNQGLRRIYDVQLSLRHGTLSSSATAIVRFEGVLKTPVPLQIREIGGPADFVRATELVKRHIEQLLGVEE